jgi:hypothetical protein
MKLPRNNSPPLVSDRTYQTYLTSKGVPEGVIHTGFPRHYEHAITRIDIDPINKINKAVTVSKQKAMMQRTMKDPFAGNYIMCIAGESNDQLPLQVGLLLFLEAAKVASRLQEKPRLLWHRVYGNTKDDLRDGNASVEMQSAGSPSFLVLSNLYTNSTGMKVEKVRDILSRYAHIPRIILLAGGNPIVFCSNVLHTHLNRVVYFSTKKEE